MDKRIVVWTETAVKQRREILKYWTKRNGSTTYAKKLIRITKSRINVILKNPDSFKISSHPKTRVSAMGHFSLFYKVTKDELIITAFWDNRQDYSKLLKLITD